MGAHVVAPQGLRVRDELPEHAAPRRQRADRALRLLVDPRGHEAREPRPRLVEDAEGRVAGAGQLTGGIQHPREHDLEIQISENVAGDAHHHVRLQTQ